MHVYSIYKKNKKECYSFTPILRWDLAAILYFFIQLLPRLKSLQIGIHEVSDFPEVVLDIF